MLYSFAIPDLRFVQLALQKYEEYETEICYTNPLSLILCCISLNGDNRQSYRQIHEGRVFVPSKRGGSSSKET